jgi:uncharacterized protein (TIGR03118 family)
MTFAFSKRRASLAALAVTASVGALIGVQPAAAGSGLGPYSQTNLVSDIPGVAPITDPHLVNPWGMSHSSTSPVWVSDNGAGVSTLYDGSGNPFPAGTPLVVRINAPPSAGPGATGTPTGQVFSGDVGGFNVAADGKSGPSIFIFATEDGTIAGWNPTVELKHAITKVDRSTVTDPAGDVGAVYKGLAIATTPGGSFIYATNFRFGQVEVFDTNFRLVSTFTDRGVPQGYAPFGIQNVGGNLVVTFAKQDAQKHDDAHGPGRGFVDVFSPSGRRLERLASRGTLNSPWGIAEAPSTFGPAARDILIGNFGDGRINAFKSSGAFKGQLSNGSGAPIAIDGLWGLIFGNGSQGASSNALYFSAGIADEAHGLFGDIVPAS